MSDRVSLQVTEIMTRSVLSVAPETPLSHIARLLVDHAISAVPVVEDGIPVGMVSESDLVARPRSSDEAASGWLKALLRTGPDCGQAFAEVFRTDLTARDVMTSPAITVDESAKLADVLEAMVKHNVKRLPVMKQGRMCGLVSRADVIKTLAKTSSISRSAEAKLRAAIEQRSPRARTEDAHRTEQQHEETESAICAVLYREAAESYSLHQAEVAIMAKRKAEEAKQREIEAMLEQPLTNGLWREILLRARSAANHGALEIEMLRFTSDVCLDNGRKINNGEPGWAETLRGLPAEVWARWESELHPKGFRLSARIIDFPNGIPGNVGLYLSWNKW